MDIDLLEDVHREGVDLRQESKNKNEREKEDEEVNPVTGDPQVILRWKLEAVESESTHAFATVGRGLETQGKAAAEDEVDWKKSVKKLKTLYPTIFLIESSETAFGSSPNVVPTIYIE